MRKTQKAKEEAKGHINIFYEYKRMLNIFLRQALNNFTIFFPLKSTAAISFTQDMKYCTKFLRLYLLQQKN